MNENGLNYIDLFAGAGGLSEGFIQSGYRPVAHVEMNEHAAKTIETRIAYYYLKDNGKIKSYYDYEKGKITREQLLEKIPKDELKTVINQEMSESTIKGIFNTIDDIKREKEIDKIDVIIGGPPCQAYSLVGRAQSSHMIVPMEDDPRNELYKMYVQFLKKYKPRMFVFENVAGIKTARGGQAFKNLQTYMKRVGYEIDYHELNAQDFGVLQSRKRVIIVGWLKGTGYEYPSFDVIHSKAEVWDLLKDLPPLTPGIEAREHTMNDMRRLKKYVKDNAIRMKSDVLTGHAARPHTAQDIEIYKRTIDMWFENEQHERLKYDDLPEDLKTHKNRTSFVDRFKVVEGDMDHCHTILAHLSKDGHYFIHPDIEQHRSITVREGVFGASDKAIGLLEGGADFEKRVTLIYQECKTTSDFTKQFKDLEKELEKKRNKKMDELKSIFTYKTEEQHKSHFNIIMKEIAEYDSQFKYWNSRSKEENEIYPKYYETNIDLEIPGIQHGYLLIGGSYVGEILEDAVFEIIDITGKIYGVSDELARDLCEKLQEQCLEEKTPNNQEILSYIDKVDEFMQQKYAESKRTVLIANQKKLDNWLQLRKEEYLLRVKDTSELDELKEKYAIEGDFRQKIALKKQIEILEEQKQKMIEAFHDEMSTLEEEAVNMQKQFAEGILVKTQLVTKIVIKF